MLVMLSLIDAGVGAKANLAVAFLMSVRVKTLAAYLFSSEWETLTILSVYDYWHWMYTSRKSHHWGRHVR